jgi:hypothetical protein
MYASQLQQRQQKLGWQLQHWLALASRHAAAAATCAAERLLLQASDTPSAALLLLTLLCLCAAGLTEP